MLGNTRLYQHTPFQDGASGVKYPANWLELSSPEDRAAIGITEYADDPVERAPIAEVAARLAAQIDSDVDAVYAQVIGQRATEYAEAEAQATVYAAAGYTGTVPAYVASWAAASGLSAQAAADSILSTAAAWRQAAAAMRAARLGHKAQARIASTMAALDTVRASWSATLGQIRGALGI